MYSAEQRLFICSAFAKYVSRRKYCQKLCKKLTEEEKVRDNPHSLQELNGIVWSEIADTARHELCHVL